MNICVKCVFMPGGILCTFLFPVWTIFTLFYNFDLFVQNMSLWPWKVVYHKERLKSKDKNGGHFNFA